jgi:hypothetical protein
VIALLRELVQRNMKVHISHIYGEGNSCLDLLDLTICRNPPMELGPLLITDASGARFVRP